MTKRDLLVELCDGYYPRWKVVDDRRQRITVVHVPDDSVRASFQSGIEQCRKWNYRIEVRPLRWYQGRLSRRQWVVIE